MAKEKILWIYVDYPPYGIVRGENKGTGILDELTDYLIKRLPHYESEKHISNVKRLLFTLKNTESSCSCGINKTPEREKELYFSLPALIAPGVGVCTRKQLVEKIGSHKKVSLKKLLNNKQLTLGIPAARSFDPSIDPIIKEHLHSKNVYSIFGTNINTSLMKMLIHKRIDYMMARPNESLYLAKKMGKAHEIINIPLEEASNYILSYIACSRNKHGFEVIKQINKILKTQRNSAEYKKLLENSIDKNYLSKFRQRYNDFFLKTTE
jgi:uncharacterized protein (TIGR02285 family)